MNNARIPDLLILDEVDTEEDLHPYADWDTEQEQGVLVMTAEDMLQYRLAKEGCQRFI